MSNPYRDPSEDPAAFLAMVTDVVVANSVAENEGKMLVHLTIQLPGLPPKKGTPAYISVTIAAEEQLKFIEARAKELGENADGTSPRAEQAFDPLGMRVAHDLLHLSGESALFDWAKVIGCHVWVKDIGSEGRAEHHIYLGYASGVLMA